jgi:hypothetical protein
LIRKGAAWSDTALRWTAQFSSRDSDLFAEEILKEDTAARGPGGGGHAALFFCVLQHVNCPRFPTIQRCAILISGISAHLD